MGEGEEDHAGISEDLADLSGVVQQVEPAELEEGVGPEALVGIGGSEDEELVGAVGMQAL